MSQSVRAVAPTLSIVEGIPTTTSVALAEFFGKQHRHVLDAVERLCAALPPEALPNFRQGVYTRLETGDQQHRQYILTRDGFTLLAMGFTGKKALTFKLAYIDAFNRMERELVGKPALPAPTITPEQAGELATRIAERFPNGIDRPYAWARFNTHFRIARYRELPAARFNEACAYIPQMPPAPQSVKSGRPTYTAEVRDGKMFMWRNEPGFREALPEPSPQVEDAKPIGNGLRSAIAQAVREEVAKSMPPSASASLKDTVNHLAHAVSQGNGYPLEPFMELYQAIHARLMRRAALPGSLP